MKSQGLFVGANGKMRTVKSCCNRNGATGYSSGGGPVMRGRGVVTSGLKSAYRRARLVADQRLSSCIHIGSRSCVEPFLVAFV